MATLSRKIREAEDVLLDAYGPYWNQTSKADYVAIISDEDWPHIKRWIKIYASASKNDLDQRLPDATYGHKHRIIFTCGERLQKLYERILKRII